MQRHNNTNIKKKQRNKSINQYRKTERHKCIKIYINKRTKTTPKHIGRMTYINKFIIKQELNTRKYRQTYISTNKKDIQTEHKKERQKNTYRHTDNNKDIQKYTKTEHEEIQTERNALI